jgi:periplasmic protein TonB
MGGAAGSTGSARARAALLAGYVERVRARVEQHREYPYLARRANLEGTICLRISIAASGSVLGITPTCGTSHEPLLAAALKSVSSAAPFPPLPAALGGRLTLDVPVVFQLDSL